MNRNPTILLCLVMSLLCLSMAYGYSTAKITAKVVDEHGKLVTGANVSISFMKAKEKGWGMTTYDREGTSGNDGLYSASGEGTQSVSIFITKDGYYPSGDGVKLISRSSLLNRWEPWNPTVEVVLKKKRNPVPMYMKGTNKLKISAFDQPVGFDLEKGDLVTPYGAGVTSDFIFVFHSDDRAYTDYVCNFTLKFLNQLDGIQEYYFDDNDQSYYKWPFEAPLSGYTGSLYKEKSMIPGKGYKSNEKKNVHYIFRIRTKTDKDGNIISALYGKIGKEFEFDPKGSIFFGYYLNPDGTPNIEEDPKKNLFGKK